MEPENSNKDSENLAEPSSIENSNKDSENLAEPSSIENSNKDSENLAEPSSISQLSEALHKEAQVCKVPMLPEEHNGEAEKLIAGENKTQASKKGTPNSLKAMSKVGKKSSGSKLAKGKETVGTSKVQKRTRRKKSKSSFQIEKVSGTNKEDAGNLEIKKNKERVVGEKKRSTEKGEDFGNLEIKKNKERVVSEKKRSTGKGVDVGNLEIKKNKERVVSEKKRSTEKREDVGNLEIKKNKERVGGEKKRSTEKGDGLDQSLKGKQHGEKNDKKIDRKEKTHRDENKKEKLGGLIFMCNGKTKPDCFRYSVMGVTMAKKDLVLSIKPGLKLFLYDFDLKLMYGIFEASSSGRMRIEPKAFGGSFPVQVRFKVCKDCLPLSESVFKKAIKDNYNDKNKFKIELTHQQARKLSKLFRPAVYQSAKRSVPVSSPPRAIVRDRKSYEGAGRPQSDRSALVRSYGDGRIYPDLSYEKDQRIDYHDVASTPREGIPRDLFITEKEYHTYGLRGERRNLTPPRRIISAFDIYKRNQDIERSRNQPEPIYRDSLPLQRESSLADAVYMPEREFRTYSLNARHELPHRASPILTTGPSSYASASDLYLKNLHPTYHYGGPSSDAYLPPRRREEVSSGSYYVDNGGGRYLVEADQLRDRGTLEVSRTYAAHPIDRPSNYNRLHSPTGALLENEPPPLSSKYYASGPSLSYR